MTASSRDLLRAFLANPRDARLGLYAGEALYRDGHAEEAVAVWALTDDVDPRVRWLHRAAGAPAEARVASELANRAFTEHFTRLHIEAIDTLASRSGADLARVHDAVWCMTHTGPVHYETPLQRPTIFYMPGLPAQPVTGSDRIAGRDALETAWQEIRAEYEAAVRAQARMEPYVPAGTPDPRWRELRGTLEWSSIHLYKDSRETPQAGMFPRTRAALEAVDLVRVDGVPMEVFFSRLRPGAHIPPHYGLTNTRLTTHLPLIVPEDCAIRVGREVCHWSEGELIAFDDSFEHEAWNRSATDRVVLIFEVHHPDLSPDERSAIEHAYAVRQAWLMQRRSLLERHLARA